MAEHTPHIGMCHSASGSVAPAYFEQLYAARSDPWDFATSAYEAGKYAATLQALPRNRYAAGLELGCSIGILTEKLAPRCTNLLATDLSAHALAQAQLRCAGLLNTSFVQEDLAVSFPRGQYDLILISEVAYYLSRPVLEQLRTRVASALLPGGHLVLVHYTGETNYPLTADEVHETFLAWSPERWRILKSTRAEHYRLDLLERTSTHAR